MTDTELMHRWSADHPLPVHVTDGKITAFVLISPTKPPSARQSRAVCVTTREYEDDWRIEFRLKDDRYYHMFKSFYEDVFESTWKTDLGHAASTFIDIYNKWIHAFSIESLSLTKDEIQGLVGEMCFIKDYLSKRYDAKTILDSWMIIERGKQDFIFPDVWYEVKSTHIGSNVITISSIEQLDNHIPGFLEVIKMKTTSINDGNKVTVNTLCKKLQKYFDDCGCGEEYSIKMNELGIPDEKYDKYVYEVIEYGEYNVDEKFPCIRRNTIPTSVGNAIYELYLDQLKQFKV